jgi:hypothetical protein
MRPRWCVRDAPPMAASNESTEGALPFLEYKGLREPWEHADCSVRRAWGRLLQGAARGTTHVHTCR